MFGIYCQNEKKKNTFDEKKIFFSKIFSTKKIRYLIKFHDNFSSYIRNDAKKKKRKTPQNDKNSHKKFLHFYHIEGSQK